ncbi:plasminogen activator inhibitor 1 RNA-binding protein-like [Hordeum vulgare]|uniref:Predicted protein n=1 Tax=Hordeum vulgare subsp. vulgare TaxID=112509 RepID=F2DNM8_HORVV|nr:RGG repeats nuclear RNA binding protein A-like [Hordeum vulgare subsp. vulgare]KAE8773319.1 plasminogen activator inhibitor 1 RNA-binding protein-like [Hordeum vulgare]BAJ96699.1 predicted protein [Hordeum vulgare subsp. vulgare]
MTSNQFDLLGDVDNDDPSQLLAAAAAKKAAEPKPAAPAAAKPASKQPAKTPPPADDARGNRGDGAGRGRGSRGGGFGRTGPRRDHGDADANGFEGGYGGGGGGYAAPRLEDGEGKQAERGRGPRQPYRGGGGRRGGYSDGQNTDEFGRPHRSYERRSGTGRGFGMKRDGAGRGNWGTATDEGFPQENVEAVNTEETPAVAEDAKTPEDAPLPEAEKVKEGAENAEEEKEAEEDKEMTLEEYEKVLEEKRKAILALKAEERKVEVDKELQSMQQLSVKKDAEEVFIKLGSDKEKKKDNAEREERAKKSLNINEFLKPAEGERYNGGRGRGRGFRGRGEPRGGYNGGGGGRRPAAAPAIEDQSQFPTLGGK